MIASFRDLTSPGTDDRKLGFRVACVPMMRLWLTLEARPDFSSVPFRPIPINPENVGADGRIFLEVEDDGQHFFRTKIELLPD
ncbi:MAG: hypothetical protein FJ385_04070 [Verrucomicrobia bacterium]|nr:hypothetical protein [Verrucomicrobiota bacterium]